MNSQALISPWTAWFRACKGERTFAIAELASFYGRQSTVGAVMRRIRCSGDCGGRVEAAWLVTGPILNARVRPRRVALHGISTRSVDDLVQAMGCAGVSKSQVSRLCADIDERVQAFLHRPIEGDWPYVGATLPT